MKLSLLPLAAVALTGCLDVTASNDTPTVVVTLSAASNNPNTCVVASPDPANIRTGQSVAFRNATGVSHTVIGEGLNTPWTVITPGQTSGAIEFSIASTRRYYVQACGSSAANLHTVVVTVN